VTGPAGARKWSTMSDLDLITVMRHASTEAETFDERMKAQLEYVDRFKKDFVAAIQPAAAPAPAPAPEPDP